MKSVKDMVAEANAKVKTVAIVEALPLLHDPNVVFVDLRDSAELHRDGRIPGAVHVNRGILEFVIDPSTPFHNPIFANGKRLVFYCAGGGRSALAAVTAQTMGLQKVAHLGGGFKAWRASGAPVER